MTSSPLPICLLTRSDLPSALALLSTGDLRPEDVLAEGTRYWGAFEGETLVGLIGCETENDCGLLRSAIVHPDYRGTGLARRLTETLLTDARERGLRSIYLFTAEGGPFWRHLGFQNVPVAEIISRLPTAPQVLLFDQLGWLPTEDCYGMNLDGESASGIPPHA